MGSSKKWAAFISSIASSLYFCFIVFQIPLFRIPCRSGKCTTPIEVTCFQLIISKVFPEFVAKFFLYPGALASAIMKGKSIPSYNKLLRLYNFTNLTNSQKTNLLRLEFHLSIPSITAFYGFKPLLMGSSKKWAAFISSIASLYFCFIVFQIPLFRIPCRRRKCTTPIEVTCFQLIRSEVFHEFVAKVLLYPGALASAIMKGKSIPSYSILLRLYNFTNLTNSQKTSLLRLEVLAGSYLSVAGALIGARRMSLIGTLLLLWGL